MTSLFDYLKQTQRFIHDSKSVMVDPFDLIEYINRARREVAMRAQCLRILPRISGSIKSIVPLTGGTGYALTDTVTISTPDFPSGAPPYPAGLQATGTLVVLDGVVTGIDITNGGNGYYNPIVTVNTKTGSGATFQVNLTAISQTVEQQEVYPFSGFDLTPFPGVKSIYMVKSVSIIYSNYRYSLPCYSFSTYQASIRQYPFQYQWVPTLCAQRGQGTNGDLYLYPIASQGYQMEVDAFCIPSDLNTDQDYEALPGPWTDAVPFYAAYFAFMELQSFNNARFMGDQFDQFMHRYGAYARPGRVTNPYGRY